MRWLSIIAVAFMWAVTNNSAVVNGTSINISTQGSTVSANSLASSCFTNPAETTVTNSNWTTASTRYLLSPVGTAGAQFTMKSIPACATRDVEWTGWMRQGYVYLRYDGNKAIYFLHNGETTNGTLDIGIVTGLDETAYPGGTYKRLYEQTNLVATIGSGGTACSCGYTKTATDGQTFTFGASGTTIYARYNGILFATIYDYHDMATGAVALKADPTGPYGFRGSPSDTPAAMTINPLHIAPLYSDFVNNKLDMRDFGLRSIKTTGSITSGTNTLTLPTTGASLGFKVGDWVIVEVGAESGGGALGTIGVGGQWPNKTYATTAAMNADTSQAPTTFAWAQDTGLTARFTGSYTAWSAVTTYNVNDLVTSSGINYFSLVNSNLNNTPASSPSDWGAIGATNTWLVSNTANWFNIISHDQYYIGKAIPYSLHGRISAISGNILTLVSETDTGGGHCINSLTFCAAANASATATNANVYLDNQPIINYIVSFQGNGYDDLTPITPTNITVSFPAGTFYISGQVIHDAQNGWNFLGAGQSSTTFQNPKGVYTSGILMGHDHSGYTASNFTLLGNMGAGASTGFGMAVPGWTYIAGGTTDTGLMPSNPNSNDSPNWLPQGGNIPTTGLQYPPGLDNSQTNNNTWQDITVTDNMAYGMRTIFSDTIAINRVTINNHANWQFYLQWEFELANTTNVTCTDCVFNGSFLSSGFECFNSSSNCKFIRPVSTNGTFSLNEAQNWLVDSGTITIPGPIAAYFGSLGTPLSGNAIFNIDTNTGGTTGPGTINNTTVNESYINASQDVLHDIEISGNSSNITITGGSFTAPGYNPLGGNTTNGNVGINSQGNTTVVNGFTSQGTTNTLKNININNPATGGTLENSTFDSCFLNSGNTFGTGNNHASC